MITVLVLALLILVNAGHSLDEVSAKEQPCFQITKTVKVDLQWLASVKKLYYPLMSRLDLYRTAKDFLEKDMKDISEAEVYYDSCMVFSMLPSGGFLGRGFNGATTNTYVKPLDPGLESFEFVSHIEKGYSGTCHITLTDNKTFVFFACCGNDNQMAWRVVSPQKTLPKETTKLIHEHALSLGYKKEYFTALRYDYCAAESEGYCSKTDDAEDCVSGYEY